MINLSTGSVCYQWYYLCSWIWNLGDGKTFKRASNACVNFFLARVKSVPNFTVFCCKSEGCRNFAFFLYFFAGILWIFTARYGTFWHFHGTLWRLWPFTLFCGKFTFAAIYALFRVKLFWHKPGSCKFDVFFHVCMKLIKTPGA